jgi:hypothetical protein
MGAFRHFISAQAYELISAPRAISTIFGVFQAIRSSFDFFFSEPSRVAGQRVVSGRNVYQAIDVVYQVTDKRTTTMLASLLQRTIVISTTVNKVYGRGYQRVNNSPRRETRRAR